MNIHFICRGNAFRSIIAEAYLNSLELEDWTARSSGAVAAAHKAGNRVAYGLTLDLLEQHGIREYAKAGYGDQLTQADLDPAGLTVCLNQRVYDDCLRLVDFPARPLIWSVADIGEPGRIAATEKNIGHFREDAYQEIVENVHRLTGRP